MEIISFEKRTFEEIAAKLDYFVQRVESLCSEHGGKETGEWMDNHEVCRRLRISPRTLQTLRDNGTLAFTKIGNRTYYRPDECGTGSRQRGGQAQGSPLERQDHLSEFQE